MAKSAAANQTGLMQYWQSHGWSSQSDVDLVRKSMAETVGSDEAAYAKAEADGRADFMFGPSGNTALSQMAIQAKTTEQAICGRFVEAAKQGAAQRAAMPATPSMQGGRPAMPRGMPRGMPGGMPGGMPAMLQGMPAMPGSVPGGTPMPGTPTTPR